MDRGGYTVMRIAVDASILGPKPVGLGVYAIQVLSAMAALAEPADELTVFTPWTRPLEGLGLKLVPITAAAGAGRRAGWARFLWNLVEYPRLLRQGRFDVAYSPTHHGAVSPSVPQVITVHDTLALHFPAQHRLQHAYFRLVLPMLAKSSACVVTVSKNSRRDISHLLGVPEEKVHAFYPGFDRKAFAPEGRGSPESPYFLAVGASFPHKNLEKLLEAYALISTRVPERLIIVGGENRYMLRLRRLSQRLGLRERIVFPGYAGQSELARLYRNATALVFPSLYEGFGLPPLEAMASGCPVVVSNSSSLPEVCGQAARYTDMTDAACLSQAMSELSQDAHLRAELAAAGTRRAAAFDWTACAQGILGMLRWAAGSRP